MKEKDLLAEAEVGRPEIAGGQGYRARAAEIIEGELSGVIDRAAPPRQGGRIFGGLQRGHGIII